MDSSKTQEPQDLPKKCFCARCFLPIDEEDKVDVGGQNFHRMCSTCCICRTIPKQLKMFYGHVFCAECFKTHVLSRFRENSRVHTDSWWMQFAPGVKCQDKASTDDSKPATDAPSAPETKRCICARCLQAVDEVDKIEIGGQAFHVCCAKCCACHQVPKENIKIYYGQVFCEDCFNRLVLNRNRDNPSEFFKSCFEQWKTNPQFAEHMKSFMASGGSEAGAPIVVVAPAPAQAAEAWRCGADGQADWFPRNEPKKSVVSMADSVGTWDLSFENRTEASDAPDSFASARDSRAAATEKIEKLTKYLRERLTNTNTETKKWKNDSLLSELQPFSNWANLNSKLSKLDCPKCLWQCGTIYVCDQKVCVEDLC